MNNNKIDPINKGKDIKADIVSRQNVDNGKYRTCQLDQLNPEYVLSIKNNDIFFLETLQMKANLADKMIWEAEENGEDTTDLNFMKELGERINNIGTPIHKRESIMTAFFVSIQLIIYYSIAIGIWSLIFSQNFLIFCFYGAIVGLIIDVIIVAPVIIVKRTKKRLKDTVGGIGSLLGNMGIVIGILGIIAWILRITLF